MVKCGGGEQELRVGVGGGQQPWSSRGSDIHELIPSWDLPGPCLRG